MDEADARAALETISVAGQTVSPIFGGWAFWTFDIDDAWIARFPRTSDIADAAKRELSLLPELYQHLSFPIPTPSHRGSWNGKPFFAYPKIPGRALTAFDGSEAVLGRLGDMISEIHAFPVDRAATLLGTGQAAGAWPDRLERLWADIEQFALPHMALDLATRVSAEFNQFVSAIGDLPVTLIHNDLGFEHLLVDESTGEPSGIIDFESAWIGDPAIDFVPLAATFGKQALRVVLGERDLGRRLDYRLWFYRWLGSVHAVIYGVTQGLDHERDSGLEQLQIRLAHHP